MGVVEIRSHQIWVAHIHGDDALRSRILGLPPGALNSTVSAARTSSQSA